MKTPTLVSLTIASHPHNAGTEHVRFSPTTPAKEGEESRFIGIGFWLRCARSSPCRGTGSGQSCIFVFRTLTDLFVLIGVLGVENRSIHEISRDSQLVYTTYVMIHISSAPYVYGRLVS